MNSAFMEPMYDTNLFCEIWDSSDSFLADYKIPVRNSPTKSLPPSLRKTR